MDFAGSNLEIYFVVGDDAGEPLSDSSGLQYYVANFNIIKQQD